MRQPRARRAAGALDGEDLAADLHEVGPLRGGAGHMGRKDPVLQPDCVFHGRRPRTPRGSERRPPLRVRGLLRVARQRGAGHEGDVAVALRPARASRRRLGRGGGRRHLLPGGQHSPLPADAGPLAAHGAGPALRAGGRRPIALQLRGRRLHPEPGCLCQGRALHGRVCQAVGQGAWRQHRGALLESGRRGAARHARQHRPRALPPIHP
mmetsp:Transcript_55304/g.171335  ORF Transcript_55304/g.171335 Transcript_55304/m.171335 type:complete len:209 (-) Transcript_55304:217-843(-)